MRNRLFLQHMIPFAILAIVAVILSASIAALRTPIASSLLAITALLFVLRPIERAARSTSRFRKRVLIVGDQPMTRKLIAEIEECPRRGYTIVGVVEETQNTYPPSSPYLVLGTLNELRTIVAAVKPDRIVLALSDRRGRMPAADLLEFQANGIVVEDVLSAYETFCGKVPIEAVTPGYLISHGIRKRRALSNAQRTASMIVAAILLVLLSPVLAIIALAIVIDSGAPVFFRQLRLGKRGRPFRLIKFRTMRPDDHESSQWARDNAGRITRLGQLLRRSRLDELPQLVNVLKGDMNLVGPRPHPVSNIELFRQAIPYYVLRCSVLPGITGWAQTRYCYANNLEQETEKMKYDLYYIKHKSLWMDAKIIFQTFGKFVTSFVSSSDGEPVPERHATRIAPVRLHARVRPRRGIRPVAMPQIRYASDSATPNSVYPTIEIEN